VQKVEATYLYQKEMEISKYELNMRDTDSKDELVTAHKGDSLQGKHNLSNRLRFTL
jgi:hypothetical protein